MNNSETKNYLTDEDIDNLCQRTYKEGFPGIKSMKILCEEKSEGSLTVHTFHKGRWSTNTKQLCHYHIRKAKKRYNMQIRKLGKKKWYYQRNYSMEMVKLVCRVGSVVLEFDEHEIKNIYGEKKLILMIKNLIGG